MKKFIIPLIAILAAALLLLTACADTPAQDSTLSQEQAAALLTQAERLTDRLVRSFAFIKAVTEKTEVTEQDLQHFLITIADLKEGDPYYGCCREENGLYTISKGALREQVYQVFGIKDVTPDSTVWDYDAETDEYSSGFGFGWGSSVTCITPSARSEGSLEKIMVDFQMVELTWDETVAPDKFLGDYTAVFSVQTDDGVSFLRFEKMWKV